MKHTAMKHTAMKTLALILLAALTFAGCTTADPEPAPTTIEWTAVEMPTNGRIDAIADLGMIVGGRKKK